MVRTIRAAAPDWRWAFSAIVQVTHGLPPKLASFPSPTRRSRKGDHARVELAVKFSPVETGTIPHLCRCRG